MKRFVLGELENWRKSKYRKPLILCGARQVGKTWVMKEFGKTFKSCVYFNFEEIKSIKQFFEMTKDVKRIVHNLSLVAGQKITEETLIIFDEIQDCSDALNSLKYFQENAPEYCVIAAGSLLGLSIAKGFPVGKVDFIKINPMSFSEFLIADDSENLYNYLNSIEKIENIPDIFYEQLSEKLKTYYIVGGMPEAVNLWTKERDISLVNNAQNGILASYERDFGKHIGDVDSIEHKYDVQKIRLIWDSVISQLSKENKKFMYSQLRKGARAREYENSLQWLVNADLLRKIYRISKHRIPIKANQEKDFFKVYHLDVGLLRKQSGLSHTAFAEDEKLFKEFKGALTENFVLESLCSIFTTELNYWSNDKCEIDFILQVDNQLVPIEVKSGKSTSSPSLNTYQKLYEGEVPLVVRYSMRNLKLDGKVLNIPLFMIDQTHKLIQISQQIKA